LVSIHAPAQGATIGMAQMLADIKVSIHAPAQGATSGAFSVNDVLRLFQFTPPRRGRL